VEPKNRLRRLTAQRLSTRMNCPACQAPIADELVIRESASLLGKRGRGKKKARSTKHCKKAAKRMWAKREEQQRAAAAAQP